MHEWKPTATCQGLNMSIIANTPKPPYFAVIFTSTRTKDGHGYDAMSDKMVDLAQLQPGFLGLESAHESVGITVSYWADLASITHWKANVEHLNAQAMGHSSWYSSFKVRIAKVERDYGLSI